MIQIISLREKSGSIATLNAGPNGQKILVKSLNSLFKSADAVVAAIPESERWNVYYTLAAHHGAETEARPVRGNKLFLWQEAIAFDIDGIDNDKLQDYIDAFCSVTGFREHELTIVASGRGLHFLIFVQPIIRDVAYFKLNKPHYNAICGKIDNKLQELGLPGKADPVVFDPARLLRLPGTINRKPSKGEDVECRLLTLNTDPRIFDFPGLSGLGDFEHENISLAEIKKKYPNPDLVEMLSDKGCPFMKECITHPATSVHEPNAFDLFSVLAQVTESSQVSVGGALKNPQAIAKWVFDNASASASLAKSNFEEKWEQARRYGVRRCETIKQRYDGCVSCPHYGQIQTPLELKSPEHIGTKDAGFWCFDSKGNRTHPHYPDLMRQFQKDQPYVVMKDRVMAFDGKCYREMPDADIKGWIEKTVRPSDPVMDRHRREALAKIKASYCLTDEASANLFEHSIKGKVNLQNGVLDVMTGEFMDHSPRLGFRYVLPFDYIVDGESEFFVDWLEQITCKRSELIETIMDFMGYIFLPSYDDHCFLYLLGDGSNGKSTLITLISNMVGAINMSAVNIIQLTANRFAPAQLEGKLVNLSEESSGKELNSEQLNVLKTLSAGGELMIERKGQDGYTMRNTAKLIFSANKAPNFAENGTAIKRRLITIPFDMQITAPDPMVPKRLAAEVPQIFSMLMRYVRHKLKKEEGKYRVSRGGETVMNVQAKLLEQGNTAIEWARDRLVVNPHLVDEYIVVDEAYGDYKDWCTSNGVDRPRNKMSFSVGVRQILSYDANKAMVKKINGKSHRVFSGCKWRRDQ